jgi:hypothetical protein
MKPLRPEVPERQQRTMTDTEVTRTGRAISADVMFTGGVPAETVEDVFRMLAGAVGDRALAYPDGEIGERSGWILNLNRTTWPEVEGVTRAYAATEDETGTPSSGFGTFRIEEGVKELDLRGVLPYSQAAIESYAIFRRLRDEGKIAGGTRFQMAIPGAHDAVVTYFRDPGDWPVAMAAWGAAVHDEYARMLEVIPAEDLVIQIDYCTELVDATGEMHRLMPWIPRVDPSDVLARYSSADYLAPLVAGLSENVLLGFHICAGTAPAYPVAALEDLSVPVAAANAIVANAGRRIDYLHLPVLSDSGDAYFAPLADLRPGQAKVYLGLECNDGIEAMNRRADAASVYLSGFGVAHYCGYYWNRDVMTRLLADLNDGANHLASLP